MPRAAVITASSRSTQYVSSKSLRTGAFHIALISSQCRRRSSRPPLILVRPVLKIMRGLHPVGERNGLDQGAFLGSAAGSGAPAAEKVSGPFSGTPEKGPDTFSSALG